MKTNTLSFDITNGDYSVFAEDSEGKSVIVIKEKGTEIIRVEGESFFDAYIKALEELDKIEKSRLNGKDKKAVTLDSLSDNEDNSEAQKENQDKDYKIKSLEHQIDELKAIIDNLYDIQEENHEKDRQIKSLENKIDVLENQIGELNTMLDRAYDTINKRDKALSVIKKTCESICGTSYFF